MVRNQVRIQVRYEVMTRETSWVDRTENQPKRPVSAENIRPSKLVVTIV